MSKVTGGQAFPRPAGDYNGSRHGNGSQDGMTLRDYFAAKAMQAMLASPGLTTGDQHKISEDAYLVADAMLKARAE